MTHKICSKCKREKKLSEFNKRNKTKDGLQYSCRECTRAEFKKHYKKNTKNILIKTQQRREQLREMFDNVKNNFSCKICGETESVCLDFHHKVKNEKDFNLADIIVRGFSWERVQKEIEKCVCVCSNCHRKIHANIIKL